MADNSHVLVFVYGTLLRGEANHHLLADAQFLGRARTACRYELVDLGPYPAMTGEGETAVSGEVYGIDEEALAELDRLEGHPGYYERACIELADGRVVQAYIMERTRVDAYPRIGSGDWLERDEYD